MDGIDSTSIDEIVRHIDALQATDSVSEKALGAIKEMAADVKELKDTTIGLAATDETSTQTDDVYSTLVEVHDTLNAIPTFEAVQITALGLIAGLMCFICFRLATHAWGRHG